MWPPRFAVWSQTIYMNVYTVHCKQHTHTNKQCVKALCTTTLTALCLQACLENTYKIKRKREKKIQNQLILLKTRLIIGNFPNDLSFFFKTSFGRCFYSLFHVFFFQRKNFWNGNRKANTFPFKMMMANDKDLMNRKMLGKTLASTDDVLILSMYYK